MSNESSTSTTTYSYPTITVTTISPPPPLFLSTLPLILQLPGDDSDGDDAHHYTAKFLAASITTLVICVFGLVGNLLCVVVLFHSRMRGSSPYVYILQGLAISDISLLVLSSIRTLGNLGVIGAWVAVMAYDDGGDDEGGGGDDGEGNNHGGGGSSSPVLPVFFFFWDWITTSSTKYYTVSVSLERFVVVIYPLKSRHLITVSRAKVFTVGVLVGCVALSCFSFAYFKWLDRGSFHVYVAVVLHFVPFVLVLGLNLVIFFKLRSHKRVRRRLTTHRHHRKTTTMRRESCGGVGARTTSSSSSSPPPLDPPASRDRTKSASPAVSPPDKSVTRMLLTVVVVFGFCYSFEFARRVMNFAWPTYMSSRPYYEFEVNILADVFYVLNSSVNFVVYCLLGDSFRVTFLDVLRRVVAFLMMREKR